MGKARKNLGLGLVCLSFVFLFNPLFSVVDFLPDIIGYLLLCVGISQLADMNYHFEEALRYFKRMLGVSAIQLFSLFILFGFVTGRERPSSILLLTFTFSVIEVIFLVHAYNELFEGFTYMGSRMDATSVFHISEVRLRRRERKILRDEKRVEKDAEIRRRKNLPPRTIKVRERRPLKNDTSRMAGFTLFFVVLKAFLTVLPEFSALTEQISDETAGFVFWYDYIGLYRTFSLSIVVVVGVIWLIRMIRYIRSIMKDRPFMQAMINKYVAEVEPKTYLFIQRAVKRAFLVLCVGVFFCIDFYVDDNSILPDFLCPIILIVALFMLRKFVKVPVTSYLLCGLYTVTSAVTYYLSASFYSNYSLTLTDIRIEAHNAFQMLTVSKIADSAVFFLMILGLLPVLSQIIKAYTGFAPISEANVQMNEKIRCVHETLRKKTYIFLAIAALCSVSSIGYILLVKNVTFMWIVDFLVCLVFAIYTIVTLNAISEEVQYKYLLS